MDRLATPHVWAAFAPPAALREQPPRVLWPWSIAVAEWTLVLLGCSPDAAAVVGAALIALRRRWLAGEIAAADVGAAVAAAREHQAEITRREAMASWRRSYHIAAVGKHAVESRCVSDASASVRLSWQAAREAAVLALHPNVGVLVSRETRRRGHRVADARTCGSFSGTCSRLRGRSAGSAAQDPARSCGGLDPAAHMSVELPPWALT